MVEVKSDEVGASYRASKCLDTCFPTGSFFRKGAFGGIFPKMGSKAQGRTLVSWPGRLSWLYGIVALCCVVLWASALPARGEERAVHWSRSYNGENIRTVTDYIDFNGEIYGLEQVPFWNDKRAHVNVNKFISAGEFQYVASMDYELLHPTRIPYYFGACVLREGIYTFVADEKGNMFYLLLNTTTNRIAVRRDLKVSLPVDLLDKLYQVRVKVILGHPFVFFVADYGDERSGMIHYVELQQSPEGFLEYLGQGAIPTGAAGSLKVHNFDVTGCTSDDHKMSVAVASLYAESVVQTVFHYGNRGDFYQGGYHGEGERGMRLQFLNISPDENNNTVQFKEVRNIQRELPYDTVGYAHRVAAINASTKPVPQEGINTLQVFVDGGSRHEQPGPGLNETTIGYTGFRITRLEFSIGSGHGENARFLGSHTSSEAEVSLPTMSDRKCWYPPNLNAFVTTEPNPDRSHDVGSLRSILSHMAVSCNLGRAVNKPGTAGFLTTYPSNIYYPDKEITNHEGQKITFPHSVNEGVDPGHAVLKGVIFGLPPYSTNDLPWAEMTKTTHVSLKDEHGHQVTGKSEHEGYWGGGIDAEWSIGFIFESSAHLKLIYTHSHSWIDETTRELTDSLEDSFTAQDNNRNVGWLILEGPYFQTFHATMADADGHSLGHEMLLHQTTGVNHLAYAFDMTRPEADKFTKGLPPMPSSDDFRGWNKVSPENWSGKDGNFSIIADLDLNADIYGHGTSHTFTQRTTHTEGGTSSHAVDFELSMYLSVKSGYKGSFTNTETESNMSSVNATLDLNPPKKGSGGGPNKIEKIQERAYLLKAKPFSPYSDSGSEKKGCPFIPDYYKTGGNDATPWCIVYRVQSWGPYKGNNTESPGLAHGATLALSGDNPRGGYVTGPDGRMVEANEVGVYDISPGVPQTIEAIPFDGWEFAGWTAYGAEVGAADAARTTVTMPEEGGSTVTASFRKIVPEALRCTYERDSGLRLEVADAHLNYAFLSFGPDQSEPMEISVGRYRFTVPAEAWMTENGSMLGEFLPEGWESGSCKVALDMNDRTWSLEIASDGSTENGLWDFADGEAVVGLDWGGESVSAKTDVKFSGVLAFAEDYLRNYNDSARAEAARDAFASGRLVLRSDPDTPADSLYRLTGVKLPPDILARDALDITIGEKTFHFQGLSETAIPPGPFPSGPPPTGVALPDAGNVSSLPRAKGGVAPLDGGGSAILLVAPDGSIDLIVSGYPLSRLCIPYTYLTVEAPEGEELFRESIPMEFFSAEISM